MKRFISGVALLSLTLAAMLGASASGQGKDKGEALKLGSLKSELLQKIVKSHLEGAYGKDPSKAAHLKALADGLGGAAGLPGRLRYVVKNGKPELTVDTTGLKEPTAADRDRAQAALRDLVGAALAKVAAEGYPDAGKKYTLAAADARAIVDSARAVYAAAPTPPAVDPVKQLQARVDQLTQDLTAMKALETRLAAAEKSVKDVDGLKKSVDSLDKQVKDVDGLKKTVDSLGKQVKEVDGLKKTVDSLGKQIKDAEGLKKTVDELGTRIKNLDTLTKSVDELGKQVKELPGRIDRVETAARNLDTVVKKVEAGLKLVDTATRKLEALPAQMKGLEGRLEKIEKAMGGVAGQDGRIKALEEQLQKERKEREGALKKLEDELKKWTTPQILPSTPLPHGTIILPHGTPCPQPVIIQSGCPCSHVLVPAVGTGCFGERFPVLSLMDLASEYGWKGDQGWGDQGWGDQAHGYGGMGYGGQPSEQLISEVPVPDAPKNSDKPRNAPKGAPKVVPGGTEGDEEGPALLQFMSRKGGTQDANGLVREATTARKVRRAGAIDLRGMTAKDAEPLFWKGYRFFWENKMVEAQAQFEAATSLFENDARFWYFRSLAESALGLTTAADTSLAQAVELHRRGLPQAELISKSLERVQGEPRMRLREALDARRTAR
ncbi:MAG: hypothetical protein U0840_17125 [Gemmataceae bacterium]